MSFVRIAVLVVAIGAGMTAWLMARNLGAGEAPPQVVEKPGDVAEVLVAAADIRPGRELSPQDLAWSEWPGDAVTPLLIQRSERPEAVEELSGTVLRGGFASGEPIREAQLVRAGKGGYLSAVLPSGMQAVATQTSPQSGAGGFILPNDRVDVILIREDASVPGAQGRDRYVGERILENVRVLAIDETVEEQDGEVVVVGNVATLELRPEQVPVLTRAQRLGDLSLALRSVIDGREFEGPVISDRANRRGGSVEVVRFGRPSRANVN